MIGRTQGQMTVMRLVKMLNEGRRLPRPDSCPEQVRSSFLYNTNTSQLIAFWGFSINKQNLLIWTVLPRFLVGRFMSWCAGAGTKSPRGESPSQPWSRSWAPCSNSSSHNHMNFKCLEIKVVLAECSAVWDCLAASHIRAPPHRDSDTKTWDQQSNLRMNKSVPLNLLGYVCIYRDLHI